MRSPQALLSSANRRSAAGPSLPPFRPSLTSLRRRPRPQAEPWSSSCSARRRPTTRCAASRPGYSAAGSLRAPNAAQTTDPCTRAKIGAKIGGKTGETGGNRQKIERDLAKIGQNLSSIPRRVGLGNLLHESRFPPKAHLVVTFKVDENGRQVHVVRRRVLVKTQPGFLCILAPKNPTIGGARVRSPRLFDGVGTWTRFLAEVRSVEGEADPWNRMREV